MNDKIKDKKRILDLLEEQRKILERCAEKVEKEEGNYHHHSLVSISEQIDEIILNYFQYLKISDKNQ